MKLLAIGQPMKQDDTKQATSYQNNVRLGKLLNTYKGKYINFSSPDMFKFLLSHLNNHGFFLDVRQGDIDCLGDGHNGQWVACFFHKNNGIKSGPWSSKDKDLYTSVVKAAIKAMEWSTERL